MTQICISGYGIHQVVVYIKYTFQIMVLLESDSNATCQLRCYSSQIRTLPVSYGATRVRFERYLAPHESS